VTALYIIAAALAGICFYLSTPHQGFVEGAAAQARALCGLGVVFTALAVMLAERILGAWPGVFAALTALMLTCVLLPYCDAWRKRSHPHSVDPSNVE